MEAWIYAMSILGCLFVIYLAFRVSYKFIFSDKLEDGCVKYGCGVFLVFSGIYLLFFTFAMLKGAFEKQPVETKVYQNVPSSKADDGYVFICTGEWATKYHSRLECKGLVRCTGDVEEVTEEEAEDMGRTPCKICY